MDSSYRETSFLTATFEPQKDYGLTTSLLTDNFIEDDLKYEHDSSTETLVTEKGELVLSNLEKSVTHNVTLSWTDICTTVTVPGRRTCFGQSIPATERKILQHVNGIVTPGTLLAILGASGSGKSTLLNVLTSRNIKQFHVTGKVQLNGVQAREGIKSMSAYVQQDDLFLDILTVREQLQFRALLKMDKRFSRRARFARVEEVITELGLTECAHSRIGTAFGSKKGISGGERKRLSFACEVLTNPPIFFCDEPTSGLDSFMAYGIVKTLQKMAWNGRTILCTIHQPSSETFAMFSQVLLLSEGRTAFMGPVDKAMDFFASQRYPCPENYNPADHFILTLSIEPGNEVETRKRANAICDAFRKSEEYKSQQMHHEALEQKAVSHDMNTILSTYDSHSRYQSSFAVQLAQLFWRAWITQARRPLFTYSKLIRSVVIGLVIGLTYFQVDIDQKGVQGINGALYFSLSNTSLANMFPVIATFPEEMSIVMREYGSTLYGLGLYYITKTSVELVGIVLDTLLYTTILYWVIGFTDSFEAFAVTCLAMTLFALTCASFGYIVSIIGGRTDVALSVNVPFMVSFMLLGDFFMNSSSVPDYIVWINRLSMFKYGFQILMATQWKDIDYIECDKPDVPGNYSIPGEDFACPFKSGKEVLKYQSIDEDDNPKNFAILGALFVGFYLLAFIGLLIRGRRAKN